MSPGAGLIVAIGPDFPDLLDGGWDYQYPSEMLGCKLYRTCMACPEQYDVFYEDQQIGYLRLRHGAFRADYPDCGGITVYEAAPEGDGVFEDEEREQYLLDAVIAIMDYHYNSLDKD